MNFLKKIDIYYVVTLLFLLMSSNANFLSANNAFWVVAIIFMLTVAIVKRTITKKDLIYWTVLMLVYLGFSFIRDFFINDLPSDYFLSDMLFLFKYVLLSFVFFTVLKEKLVDYIIKVMLHLTIISFVFYFVQVIGQGKELYNFSNFLNLPKPFDSDEGYSNFVVFTFTLGRHDYSNSGFVWEPGGFGCFLMITLLLHFFKNKFTFDRTAWVFIIACVTTFSTTSYVALSLMLFFAYRYKFPDKSMWLVVFIPVIITVFATVPILGDKIYNTYNSDMQDLNLMRVHERWYHSQKQQLPLNRFASAVFLYQSFGEKLILGVSNKYDALIAKKHDLNIANGVFDFCARFGLIFLIYLFYRYLTYCHRYLRRVEYIIYCGLILFILGFGILLFLPIILVFLFLPLLPVERKEKPAVDPFSTQKTFA